MARDRGALRSSAAQQTTLAADLACSLDPVVFSSTKLHIPPDDWQAKALRSSHPRLLLNCCRQSGKSTTAAVIGLHTAIYKPRSLTLLLSPSQRQSKELFRKVLAGYCFLGRPVAPEAENAMSLALENGSRVVSLPGNESTVRGYSKVNLLIVDEAAQVTDNLYRSVRPMLAVSGGRLITMSTPFGVSGWWAEAWHRDTASDRWERYKVPAYNVSRIDPAFLEEERAELGEWSYAQEYECKFMADEFAVFREEDIAALINPELEAWRL